MNDGYVSGLELPVKVRDAEGRDYTLRRQIGAGGQGVVYEVAGGSLAVKVIEAPSDLEKRRLQESLDVVRRLPLQDLPVARPLALLGGTWTGYVMSLLSGLETWHALHRAPVERAEIASWHSESGGLRRRLELARSLTETISVLGERGLVYGDLSPNNVLVTSPLDDSETWLIDLDNLRLTTVAGADYCTRGYGAPEVIMGAAPASTLSDAWSVAVLVFQSLRLAHPFLGDVVADGPPEAEDAALEGRLPWIDHPTDESNRSSQALPPTAVTTKSLRRLFQACFVRGVDDRFARPSSGSYAAALRESLLLLVPCTACGADFLYTSLRAKCMYCGHAQHDVTLLRVVASPLTAEEASLYDRTPRDAVVPGSWIALARDQKVLLPQSLLAYNGGGAPCLELEGGTSGRIRVRARGESTVARRSKDGTMKRLHPDGRTFSRDEPFELRVGDMQRPHKYLVRRDAG